MNHPSPTYFRKVIKVCATDSPNVRRWLKYREAGLPPVNELLVPGVLTGPEYEMRRATWDKVRACIGLDAEFYTGGELLLFPPEWLNRAASAVLVRKCIEAPTEGIGIDPAEGGDSTAYAAVNRWGLKELVSVKTPNTHVIIGETVAFMRKHGMLDKPEYVVFDRGGGGKQHEDSLKALGHQVRSVGFGEAPNLEMKRGLHQLEQRKDVKEDQYAYVNLRAQMYHELSQCVDPASWITGFPTVMQTIKGLEYLKPSVVAIQPVPGETEEEFRRRSTRLLERGSDTSVGFAIPGEGCGEQYVRLRQQLSVMPKDTNEEGRYKLPPKHRRDPNDKRQTLVDMIGHSPDEADAVVLAVFAMIHKSRRPKMGAA